MAELTTLELKLNTAQFLIENALTDEKQEELICKELLNDTFDFADYEIEQETGISEEGFVEEEPGFADDEQTPFEEVPEEEFGDVFAPQSRAR